MGKFIIKKMGDKYQFVLEASSGEVIGQGELEKDLSTVKTNVEAVKSNYSRQEAFTVKKAQNDKLFFVLRDENGKEILRSKMYSKESSAQHGISAVSKNIPDANTYDRSTPGKSTLI